MAATRSLAQKRANVSHEASQYSIGHLSRVRLQPLAQIQLKTALAAAMAADPVGIVAAHKLAEFAARAHPEDALKWSLYSGDYIHLQCPGPTFVRANKCVRNAELHRQGPDTAAEAYVVLNPPEVTDEEGEDPSCASLAQWSQCMVICLLRSLGAAATHLKHRLL